LQHEVPASDLKYLTQAKYLKNDPVGNITKDILIPIANDIGTLACHNPDRYKSSLDDKIVASFDILQLGGVGEDGRPIEGMEGDKLMSDLKTYQAYTKRSPNGEPD